MDAKEHELSSAFTVIYGRDQSETAGSSSSKPRLFKYISNLSLFLEELHRQTEMKMSREECEDIYSSVIEIVWGILELVEKINPMYKVSKVLPVGSYVEGTRLVHPSEFDFVAEIKMLSENNITECKAECKSLGTVQVLLRNLSMLNELDRITYRTKHDEKDVSNLSESVYISPTAFREDFWSYFNAAAVHLMRGGVRIERSSGFLTLFPDLPQHLDLNSTGPNIETAMCWTSASYQERFGISVDVTPVVSISNNIPQSCGVNTQLLHEVTDGNYQMRVVPTVNHECENAGLNNFDSMLCWRLSFSVIETSMVQRMKTSHLKCLRLLKYIKGKHGDPLKELEDMGMCGLKEKGLCAITLNLIHHMGDMNLLTTYMMKMAVLHHECQCKEIDENLGSCMLSIINYLRSCAKNSFLPNVFMPEKNSWSRLSKSPGVWTGFTISCYRQTGESV